MHGARFPPRPLDALQTRAEPAMAEHPTTVGLLAALGALGWLVFLAGVGATQAACGAANYQSGGAAGFLGPVSCGALFGFAWWVVIYEAAVLGGVVAAVAATALDEWAAPLAGLLGVATVLSMDAANTYRLLERVPGVEDRSRPRAALAGAVILAIAKSVCGLVVGKLGCGFEHCAADMLTSSRPPAPLPRRAQPRPARHARPRARRERGDGQRAREGAGRGARRVRGPPAAAGLISGRGAAGRGDFKERAPLSICPQCQGKTWVTRRRKFAY